MEESGLLSREELLGGLASRYTKRAGTILFAIQTRVHHLIQSRQAMEYYLSDEAAKEREAAYLEALALGREQDFRNSIQQLERFAPKWASLVPDNPQIQAALAHLLGQNYKFTHKRTPEIRRALQLDDPRIWDAYEKLFQKNISTIYASEDSPLELVRWAWTDADAWVESLNPFWIVFVLVLTETVGAGILAIPIALAHLGVSTGLVLLAGLGLLNLMTVFFMAEAVSRYGDIRYGRGFIGRMTDNFLGAGASRVLSLGMSVGGFLALTAYYIGFSTTMEDAVHLPAELWVLLLFLAGVYFLKRKNLNATVGFAIMVGAVNIGLICILSLVSFTSLVPSNLALDRAVIRGASLTDPLVWQSAFGVLLLAFNGHMSISNSARLVIHRDPSCRSLIWGAAAALGTAFLLYALWVTAVIGAVPRAVLIGQTGTVLIPLAAELGPSIHVFGTIFIILGLGMATVHRSLGLFNLVGERLPKKIGSFELSQGSVRFVLGLLPVIAVFFLAEWFLFNNKESFTKSLNFLGVIVVPLLGGVFPVLLYRAALKKGERSPEKPLTWLSKPRLMAAVYILFVLTFFLHGLFLWKNAGQILAVLLVGVLTLFMTWRFFKAGAFEPRVLVELRSEQGKPDLAWLTVTIGAVRAAGVQVRLIGGKPETEIGPDGRVEDFNRLSGIEIHLPAGLARGLKIWAHETTPEGGSEQMQGVEAEIRGLGHSAQELPLSRSRGQRTTTIGYQPVEVILELPKPADDWRAALVF